MDYKLEITNAGDQQACLQISGRLDYDTVSGIDREAVRHFGQYPRIEIDLSAITYVNSAGLALLLDWSRLAEEQNKELLIRNPPKKLRDIARLGELEKFLFR